ncbi:alpha/beta hydrolase [Phycisphaera mikurensis]|uniref:Putative esterase n=1 Tax=Phycisphaera mikurensis (strain NBRC 102666 / KCTC 22515 / FYK2301M01) TaxID=1142394 RepID=I0IBR8_PHYMF|nr:alpha/beta hydrolase [Phycisphaera mikurensis]MBB6442062.1 acetyl esterase/lipase [Phycisphaera mikurensis]BAM02706.1 putative esterase [Phycisphaera mikurensis NBRC 102666]
MLPRTQPRDVDLERRRERSALHRNRIYADPDGVPLLLDLYRPPADAPVPVVVWLHGGGWKSGSKDHCVVRWFVRYGYAVAAASYRLLPRHRHPAQADDARAAVRFVRAHAEEWGVDPRRITLGGVSAGAYLACLVGVTPGPLAAAAGLDAGRPDGVVEPVLAATRRVDDRVESVVNVSGFTDFPALQGLPSRRAGKASPESALLGVEPRTVPERLAAVSPLTHVAAAAEAGVLPRFVHAHGEANRVIPPDQARRLHAAVRAAGGRSKLLEMKGSGHGDPRLLSEAGARGRIVDFLNLAEALPAA